MDCLETPLPSSPPLIPFLLSPNSQAEAAPRDDGGFLDAVFSGLRMLISIVVFLGLCAFTAYVALVCTTLFFAALQVFFGTLVPSALLIFQFLLSALLLLFCLQWMREILTLQFRCNNPL